MNITVNVPQCYKEITNKLFYDISNASSITEKRKIFEAFCCCYTMIPELWEFWAKQEAKTGIFYHDPKFMKVLLKLRFRSQNHFYHETSMKCVYDENHLSYYYKYFENTKYVLTCPYFDSLQYHCLDIHERQKSVELLKDALTFPHCYLKEALKLYYEYSASPIDKSILQQVDENILLYEKIVKAKNNAEWFKYLSLTNNEKCIIQNIECRLGKNPENKYLWKEYKSFLIEKTNLKVLDVFRRYCRFFFNEIEIHKEYENAIQKFNDLGFNVSKWMIDLVLIKKEFVSLDSALKWMLKCLKIANFNSKCLTKFASKFSKRYGCLTDINPAITDYKQRLQDMKYKNKIPFENQLAECNYNYNYADKSFINTVSFQSKYFKLFPKPIIKYMNDQIKSNFILYNKAIKICKYFFVKNNYIIPVWYLGVQNKSSENFTTSYHETSLYINAFKQSTLKQKIWIGNSVYCSLRPQNYVTNTWKFRNQIYSSDIRHLRIEEHGLLFSEYNMLTKKKLIEKIYLFKVFLTYDSTGLNVTLEDIIENLPNAYHITLIIENISVTKGTFKKMLSFGRNQRFKEFWVSSSLECLQTDHCFNKHLPNLKEFIKRYAAPRSAFAMFFRNLNEAENCRLQQLLTMFQELKSSWESPNEVPTLHAASGNW